MLGRVVNMAILPAHVAMDNRLVQGVGATEALGVGRHRDDRWAVANDGLPIAVTFFLLTCYSTAMCNAAAEPRAVFGMGCDAATPPYRSVGQHVVSNARCGSEPLRSSDRAVRV